MKKILAATVLAALLTACGSSDQAISIEEPWARVTGSSAAVYMTVTNNTETDNALTGIEIDPSVAESAMAHDTQTDDAGMMTMTEQDGIAIPAGKSVEFKTASYHVMVMGIQDRDAKTLPITLDFQDGTKQTIDAEVRESN